MQLGAEHPLLRSVFNGLIRPRIFPENMGRAWLRHNVEEVGNLEFFLPELYAAEGTQAVQATRSTPSPSRGAPQEQPGPSPLPLHT